MNPDHLATAFAVWSAVVLMVGAAITWELSRLRSELGQMGERLNTLVVEFEHRLTAVEVDIGRCQVALKKRKVADE